jgi:multiple sugar transport system permease protein
MDGCGYFATYRHVVLPLVKPSLAAIAIFQFQATWNDFLGPLVYLNSQDLYPLALGLFEFKEQHSVEYGMLMAASTLMTMPVVILFLVAQRYFIQGVTLTGLKG